MQILNEVGRPYAIDSITAPLNITHFWVLSCHMMDFKLEALTYLEETTGPTIKIKAQNTIIEMPTSWSILAVDKETYTIDSIPVPNCATFNHDILLFSPNDSKLATCNISVVDYFEKKSCIHPMIPKGSAMIHPTGIGESHGEQLMYGIVCGPYDLFRFIGNKTVGDILG